MRAYLRDCCSVVKDWIPGKSVDIFFGRPYLKSSKVSISFNVESTWNSTALFASWAIFSISKRVKLAIRRSVQKKNTFFKRSSGVDITQHFLLNKKLLGHSV